jgi:hypothetical protein
MGRSSKDFPPVTRKGRLPKRARVSGILRASPGPNRISGGVRKAKDMAYA